MTESYNSIETNQPDHSTLPAPLFDANASASAQPVEPIRSSSLSKIGNRVRSVSRRIDGQSRMLAVVILIGLITGALAGMLLVNLARPSAPATVSEVPSNEPGSEIPVSEAQKLDTFSAALGGGEVSAVSSTVTRNRRPRSRVRTTRHRAYRVAVIR